jgi:uncharacterized iron-regulated protein
MFNMKMVVTIILALAAGCASCGSFGHDHGDFQLSVSESTPSSLPRTVDPANQQQLDALTGQIANNRALFIGEVHDRIEHHQNQLRVIQNLYANYPDLAIGVEYFQQPFQQYLDDYIAGRIDERTMLRKTEYFKRWQVDYRLMQPIFTFAREKHIPIVALNVPDEIHNKVFKKGMKSLSPIELAQTPDYILPASEHYLQYLRTIFNSHPTSNGFGTFVEGVLLWDESMAYTAARYLKKHPRSRMVILAGMVHVMYGDGIPERVNLRLGANLSTVMINGIDFGNNPGIADYQLVTEGGLELPKSGKLGVSIIDGRDGVRINEFTQGGAAQSTGIAVGDRIVALDGVKVGNILELKSVMFDKRPGDRMRVLIQRNLSSDTRVESLFEVVLR